MRLIEIPDDGFITKPIMRGVDTIGEQRIDLSDYPTVDAVPVVRCKDCAYRKNCGFELHFERMGLNDGYCRAGRRLDDD